MRSYLNNAATFFLGAALSLRSGPLDARHHATDYDYIGQRKKTFGLLDYNAHYYDPLIGKFISADTIVPDPSNPQAFNRYGYAYNNPIRFNDPTGHYAFEEQPDDYFFIPTSRSPSGQSMRMIGDTCFGECDGPAPIDPESQAILEAGTGALCEACDWSITLNHWRQGDFHWTDTIGLLPFVPISMVRAAKEFGLNNLPILDPDCSRVCRCDEEVIKCSFLSTLICMQT